MVTLQRVLDAVGPPLASVLVQPGNPGAPVADLVIVEPLALPEIHPGDLVLGVSIADSAQALALIARSGDRGAAALVLKEPIAAEPELARAADRAGVALLAVQRRAAWTQVFAVLRSLLDAGSTAPPDLTGAGEFTDLFTLADAISTVIDAPVTIEDASSRVLGYSARQDNTDAARVATIIGRRNPDATLDQFRRRGVFRELRKVTQPVFVPSLEDGTLPRLIMPVRVGAELLGSIWAVVAGPVDPARSAALADAAGLVAVQLLRLRAGSDVERRLMRDLVASVLHGSGDVASAAQRLGLRAGPHRAVAIGLSHRAGNDRRSAEDAETLHLALWERLRTACGLPTRTPLAEIGGTLYAIIEDHGSTGRDADRWPWLKPALAPLDSGVRLTAGIGAPATRVADLAASRAQADETLALLRSGDPSPPWARHEDVWARLVVRRVAGSTALADLMSSGPIPVLLEHDEAHGTRYVDTLAAWLADPNDPTTVARRLHIHRNTLRYRLQRIAELTPLALDDPDVRLAAALQLVVAGTSPSS